MATLIFNRKFHAQVNELIWNGSLTDEELATAYRRSIKMGAMFDSRCFNIPKEEVTNYILWRQQDATRNSINSVGQAYFPHKQLEGLTKSKNCFLKKKESTGMIILLSTEEEVVVSKTPYRKE